MAGTTIRASTPETRETLPYRAQVVGVQSRASKTRKKFVRRNDRDVSQPIRLGIQIIFLILNLWVGLQFYLFVHWAETGGRTSSVSRPAGVEGWLPIEGMMQFKYVVATGEIPRLHPAAFFLFTAFALTSLFFRKAFCSWLCPVGTLSEFLWKLGRRVFGRNLSLPNWLDYPLRSLKYFLLGFFVYAVAMMSAAAIADFVASPYGLVVDVRMLNFFRFMGSTTAVVVGLLVLASLLVRNSWCRYLCPYGALMGLISLMSPLRIARNESACIDCAKCAKACPSALPVDKLVQIRSSECTGCLECVAVCPARNALSMNLIGSRGARRCLSAWQLAAGIGIIFCGLVGYAKLTDHWQSHLPHQVFLKLVPVAGQQRHPMIEGKVGEHRE